MTDLSHIRYRGLADKVMSAEEAAALIEPGSNVGMSGFTGAGYPKAVPTALARRITEASARGERFRVGVWTGASTAPELDGALASVDGIDLRMPYQSDPVSQDQCRAHGLPRRAPLARSADGVAGLLRAPGHRTRRGRR